MARSGDRLNASYDAERETSAPAAFDAHGSHTAPGSGKRHFLRSIVSGVTTTVMILAIALAALLVGVRLVGFDVYTVLSGSMEPTYHTGSVIYVKPCEPEEVQVGDPITFVLNEDLVVATHRVIGIDEVEGAFYTKGDANAAEDASPVLYENLIGKPVFSIPYLGYVAAYVQEPPGTYIAIVVCALLIMLTFLPDLFSKEEDEEPRKKQKRGKKGKEMVVPKQESVVANDRAMQQASARQAVARQRAVPSVNELELDPVSPGQIRRHQRQMVDSGYAAQPQPAQGQQARRAAREQVPQVDQPNNPRLRTQAQADAAQPRGRHARPASQDPRTHLSDSAPAGNDPQGRRRNH